MTRIRPVILLLPIVALVVCGPGGAPKEEEPPPPPPVSINIIEASATVEVGKTFQFHYSVSNSSNTACAWSVNDVAGGNATFGTIISNGLYTAPAAVPSPAQVTVKAVAAADTSKSDTAAVTIAPPAPFSISPPAATVPAGATQQFTTTAEVTWSVEGGSGNTAPIGSISSDGLYTAPFSPPLGGTVTIVATSKYDTSVKATATATVTFSNASLHGPYAFVFRSADAADTTVIGGRLDADGAGGISNGVLYMNQPSGSVSATFTGTYQAAADGRAALSLQVDTSTIPLRLVLRSDVSGRMIGFAAGQSGFGELERGVAPAPYDSGLAEGTFVFAYDGLDHYTGENPTCGQPIAAVGRFTLAYDSLNTIDYGISDINRNGAWIVSGDSGSTFRGDYTYNGNGSGTMGFQSSGARFISFYLLSADEALFITTDWGTFLGDRIGAVGRIVRAGAGPFSMASVSGDLAMSSQGYTAIASPPPDPFVPPDPAFSSGVLSADGAGHITGGLTDTNVGGTVGQALPVTGGYSMSANGRGTASFTAGGLTNHTAVYMISDNTAYAVGLDSWGTGISLFTPQGGNKPYSAASLSGHYAFAMRGTLTGLGTDAVGQILFDGQGGLNGWVDVNAAGVLSTNVGLSGTYTMNSTGRGRATIYCSAGTWVLTMYVKDAETLSLVRTDAPGDGSLVRQY